MKQSTVVKLGSSFEYNTLVGIDSAQAALQTLEHNLAATNIETLQNFNRAYLVITQNVRSVIKKGAFNDPKFLSKFDAKFVYYYVHALHMYNTGGNVPPAWNQAFTASKQDNNSPLKTMALGVNAHINNDIPQVLYDTKAGKNRYKDYLQINVIIKHSIYEVIDNLDSYKHPLNPKYKLLKPLYKFSMNILVIIWRRSAWKNYQKLENGSMNVQDIEASALRLSKLIKRIPI